MVAPVEITVEDISSVFPRPLEEDEQERAEALIKQAVELIAFEFARRGRDLAEEVETTPWLQVAVLQAVRIMVSRAVLIGENVGRASASSTSGPQSDSITFSQGVGIHWVVWGWTSPFSIFLVCTRVRCRVAWWAGDPVWDALAGSPVRGGCGKATVVLMGWKPDDFGEPVAIKGG
ncbi:Gp19/Gp15/Gp42 family protein [Corynebacterium glucuronolyticum]|uniref:Gp19/Gp15/Gp42 family protein n=1 Tax=Corynebacterium glucuronolyticum TaxID=39791 RepID=UPI001E642717|nr:Gp19/Gp15/Gp42 family protein [Corynebacterium glucuronolyticum]